MAPQRSLSQDEEGKQKQNGPRWIWFIAGPTACGKSTVAKSLADKLGFTFLEGDDFHPKANQEKMSHNQPLTDDDRAGWLQALREHETSRPPAGASTPHLVVTCSALKRQYRDVLRQGGDGGLRVRFVFLDVDEEVLKQRARERKGHFAGEGLVQSQMEAWEFPDEKEEGDVFVVRVGRESGVEDTEGEVLRRVKEVMGV